MNNLIMEIDWKLVMKYQRVSAGVACLGPSCRVWPGLPACLPAQEFLLFKKSIWDLTICYYAMITYNGWLLNTTCTTTRG